MWKTEQCCYLEIGPIKIEQIDVLIHPYHSQTYGIDAMCISIIRESVLKFTNIEEYFKWKFAKSTKSIYLLIWMKVTEYMANA